MIAPGTPEEAEAARRIAYWSAMVRHWNVDADTFRRTARGDGWVTSDVLDEAERTRGAIRRAVADVDKVADSLPPGHDLRTDLMHIAAALDGLLESLATTVEAIEPLIGERSDAGRLKYLAPQHDF